MDTYREVVCKGLCSFYKEGRDKGCGTFTYLKRNLSPGEVRLFASGLKAPDFSRDNDLRHLACYKCDFLADGCDFRQGSSTNPCGGYSLIESLLKQ